MDITEGNKLIAKWLKWKFNSKGDKVDCPLTSAPWPPIECLNFHRSWDWLMPVVEKIESFQGQHVGCGVSIHQNGVLLGYNESSKDLHFQKHIYGNGKSKIENTWQAVVAFIQWYNQQPKTA